MLPERLHKKINERIEKNALRKLSSSKAKIDFSSNDYLGFAQSEVIFKKTTAFLKENRILINGATGSRLLTGNHILYDEVENFLCDFHNVEAALIFNSGYDANIGFFSSIPQKDDIVFFDEYIHASIRDGIQMSHAKAYKFKHNKIEDLEKRIKQIRDKETNTIIYVVTESVFSMDGDTPDLKAISDLCNTYNTYLIIDEAHAIGIFGKDGNGLVQSLTLENKVFARIITFGKALGCHGAAILCSKELKEYLVNFARSIIYTTGLPPHSLAAIKSAYEELFAISDKDKITNIKKLHKNIDFFKTQLKNTKLDAYFIESESAIHCCVIPGNEKVKFIANSLQEKNFDVKPILSPTVAVDEERLRFCVHTYNSKEEITAVLKLLKTLM